MLSAVLRVAKNVLRVFTALCDERFDRHKQHRKYIDAGHAAGFRAQKRHRAEGYIGFIQAAFHAFSKETLVEQETLRAV